MSDNSNLKKISVSKTDLTDRVLESMVLFLRNPECSIVDLDISRNLITDVGLSTLC